MSRRPCGGCCRRNQFEVTFDTAFGGSACAACAPGPGSGPPRPSRLCMMRATRIRSRCGTARGIWPADSTGLPVGNAFVTEKMFARQPDASKIGLVTLSATSSMGLRAQRRQAHERSIEPAGLHSDAEGRIQRADGEGDEQAPTRKGKWSVEMGLDAARWNPKVPNARAGRRKARAGQYGVHSRYRLSTWLKGIAVCRDFRRTLPELGAFHATKLTCRGLPSPFVWPFLPCIVAAPAMIGAT